MATKLADAYVQIIPSAKGIQGSITQALGGESEKAGAVAGAGIASKLKGAIAAAGIGTAVAKIVKDSLDQGKELQQNIGGTEAVFGEFAQTIQDDAYEAYKNMGLSASDYMATANKMGSLFQGSGLEQQEAMDLTSKAMQRAADVASVMGLDMNSAMESIAGAAKGNFTMMDNLGVAMNATTLEAYALEKGVNFKWNTASNAEKAQLAMEMFFDRTSQYAGNFADEADRTFSGSFEAMAAAAKNVLGNMSLGEDVSGPLKALLSSTKTFLTGNLLPMIGNIIRSVPSIFSTVFQMASQAITSINWVEAGQNLIDKIKEGLSNLATDIPQAMKDIGDSAKEWFESVDWKTTGSAIIGFLKDGITIFTEDIPNLIKDIGLTAIEWIKGIDWLETGKNIINFIKDGITVLLDSIPTLIQNIGNTAIAWFEAINWSNVGKTIIGLLKAGIQAVFVDIPNKLFEIAGQTLTYFKAVLWEKTGGDVIGFILKGIVGLVTSIPEKLLEIGNTAISYFKASLWVQSGKDIITKIVNGVVEFVTKIPDKLLEIAGNAITNFKAALWKDSGQRIITKIVSGIKEFFSKIPDKLMEIVKDAIAKITDLETWKQVGKDMINGIVDGIKSIPGAIKDALEGAAKSALDGVKGLLGIASPSKVFRDEVGKPIAWGITEGFNEGAAGLADDMVSQINAAKKAVDTNIGMESRYTMGGRSKQLDDMPYQIAGAVLEGVQQIADGVEKGIGKMKIVANNRETARFVADLGFARS